MSLPRAVLRDPDRRLPLHMAWVALLLVVAKLVSAVKEILLAQAYGVGPLMDAYQFVFQLVSWPVSIFFAISAAALVPAYAGLRQLGPSHLMRFRAQAHGATLALGLLLSGGWLLLCLATPLLTTWSGLAPAAQSHAARMALPMTAMIVCGLYTALLASECISARHQGNTLLEAMPAVVLGAMLLATARPDADTLLAGTVAGALAHTGVLALYTGRRMQLPRPAVRFDHPEWTPLLAALGTLLIAQVLQAATSVVDQFWAARAGDGAVSVIGYANRILFVVLGIGSAAISRAILPTLAGLSVDQSAYARQIAMRWALRLFGLACLGVLVLWPASSWVVSVLFERGAFGAEETQRVAAFLRFSWLQIPAGFAALVLIQQVLAERRYRVLTIVAAVNLAVKLLGNAVLTHWFGVEGLALSTALMNLATMTLLLVWSRTRQHV